MKLIFKIILLIFITGNMFSQQVVMFNNYFFKPMVNNPAYTAIDSVPNLMLVNHTQWTGFKGGPQYNILTFDGNLINKNTGLGVVVFSDKKGLNNRIGGDVSYSYKLRFKNKLKIQLGLSIGVVNQSIDYSKAITESQNDPSLFSNNQNKTTFNANVGVAVLYKGLDFGFAAPQVANNKINYVSNNDSRTFYSQSRHYMSSLGYKILLSKAKKVSITPQALVRYMAATPIQYDGNLKLDLQNKMWLAATYKSNYAIGLNLGVILFKRLTISYSYDYITGNLNKNAGLSHEIMLNFKFLKRRDFTEEQKEDALLKKLAAQNLNKLLIQKLLKRIEEVLDKDNPTKEEIQSLMDEISSFFDDESTDPLQETLNKYYKSLKNQAQGEINVLLKGKVVFEDIKTEPDYSYIIINVIDAITKQVVATSAPSSKNGNYFIIIKPSKKYIITAEKQGYQSYKKEISVAATPESYELSHQIILKK
jgi:type IX secretion system PorP/SprF family membrane protein